MTAEIRLVEAALVLAAERQPVAPVSLAAGDRLSRQFDCRSAIGSIAAGESLSRLACTYRPRFA